MYLHLSFFDVLPPICTYIGTVVQLAQLGKFTNQIQLGEGSNDPYTLSDGRYLRLKSSSYCQYG